ncbi:MAG: tryptophan 7-halogenase [Wenzhouxiangella sp.]|nr:MAG: tryptophan 7-halogenase [Wenzhouxiangella sp.]
MHASDIDRFRRIIIVGGGTAGWMAAAALAKTFGTRKHIELIESDEIGTVGVGEATIPAIKNFHLLLELDEAEFLQAVNGTFKLGIEFENWGRLGERYFHPFGPPGADAWAAQFHHYWLKARTLGEPGSLNDFSFEANLARAGRFGMNGEPRPNYAYHFDAGLYARLLRRYSEARGVRRTEGKVVDVRLHPDSGLIGSVALESGHEVAGDFFIDCSGFRGLLIEQALKTGWEDWSHWLQSDSAVAVQSESVSPPIPYTRATARSAGWQWKIPLQHRVGNGIVFSSRYMTEDQARKLLLDNIDGRAITEPRCIRFRTGRRLRQWNRNCLALGLASGFLEPLESTSIHMIQNSLIRFIKLFPAGRIEPAEVDQFNNDVRLEAEYIRDFIILHYHVNQRTDSDYWIDCRKMSVPETLAHKIRLFASNARVFRDQYELFAEQSWVAVMTGQGIKPAGHHPFVNNLPDAELMDLMTETKSRMAEHVRRQPAHQDYLDGLNARLQSAARARGGRS